MQQKTLSEKVEIDGIGLHSGCSSKLVFKPAAENTGIVFVRSDLKDNNRFQVLTKFGTGEYMHSFMGAALLFYLRATGRIV